MNEKRHMWYVREWGQGSLNSSEKRKWSKLKCVFSVCVYMCMCVYSSSVFMVPFFVVLSFPIFMCVCMLSVDPTFDIIHCTCGPF